MTQKQIEQSGRHLKYKPDIVLTVKKTNKNCFVDRKEYILCAAVWYKDGITHEHQPENIPNGFVICGHRHHNCLTTPKIFLDTPSGFEKVQGFLTNENRFLDRVDSCRVAVEAGQFKDTLNSKILMSEDLY